MEIEAQLAEEAKERQKAAAVEGGKRSGEARREKAETKTQTLKDVAREPTKVVEFVPQPSKPEPKARDRAASLVGTNPRYIQDAKTIANVSPAHIQSESQ